jgi:hypothetical protein
MKAFLSIYVWFDIFNISDPICTSQLVFANLLKKSLKFFWISQWYKNMISKGIFKFLKILSLFQMLFLWINKSSHWRSSPLSCQEGFCNLNNFCPFLKKFLENRLVVRSYCFGRINFSPFGIKRQKQKTWEAYSFLPICKKDMSESLWVWQRINDTERVVVEALPLPKTPFPFQSKTNVILAPILMNQLFIIG